MNRKDMGAALAALQRHDDVEVCKVCGSTTLVGDLCVDCIESDRLYWAPGGWRRTNPPDREPALPRRDTPCPALPGLAQPSLAVDTLSEASGKRKWTRGYMLRRLAKQLCWAVFGGVTRDWRAHQRVVAQRRAQEATRKAVLP